MPKPAPLRHYLARKRTAGEEPSEGSTGQLAEDEELKISEEHQVTDPLLVRAPAAGGVAIGGVTGGQAAEAPAELPPHARSRGHQSARWRDPQASNRLACREHVRCESLDLAMQPGTSSRPARSEP